MLFTEARFIVFFLVVFLVHWSLGSHRLRKLWLLVTSYVFYGAWDWRFLSLIFLSTAVDYIAGARIASGQTQRVRRIWLAVSMSANLGILCFFKYFNFFSETATDFLRLLGFQANEFTLRILLPVGISFFTFQTMSYTIDVYRKRLEPVRDFFDFAVFVAFFPQLVAGPIVRAVQFLPQLKKQRVFAKHVDVRACLTLFLIGYLKKAVLADQVAIEVDPVFANPGAWSQSGTWIALALYYVQIYGDFSGYTDMAIATGGLLGYKLPINFHFPYFSSSSIQFWRRWHISLSSWMRDYVYVSMDRAKIGWGNINLVFTFVLIGLWHGASWNFIVFGLLHGIFIVINGLWSRKFPRMFAGTGGAIAGNMMIHFCGFISLAFFRCQTLPQATTMLSTGFGLREGGNGTISAYWLLFLAGCLAVHWLFYKGAGKYIGRLPNHVYAFAYGAAWAVILPWAAQDYQAFIYFQF